VALVRPSHPYPEPSWRGWGDPEKVPELPDSVRQLLAEGLGVRPDASSRPLRLADLRLPRPRIGAESVAAVGRVVGAEHVLADDETRIRHTRGRSTPDLLRIRGAELGGAPDLVLRPASHEEILEVLRICSERRIAVVPYGGGTSVVGGLEPQTSDFDGVIALDLRRMDALVGLDEESRLVVLEPGLRGPQAEALLGERGFTLGHFPQSFEYATLGGFAATRSSGQASAGYGRFDELVMALRVATPAGTLMLGRAPKSAAGPDLRQLLLGSEGALGVITSLTLQVRPRPAERIYEGWRLPSFDLGIDVLRQLAQDGPRPTVLRLSDEAETALNLAQLAKLGSGGGGGGCLAVVGYEGSAEDVQARRAAGARVLEAAGGQIEPGAGEAWERDRYRAPYLRDALLDAGALVDTLETVTFWSALRGTYRAVADALRDSLSAQGTPPVVLCHVSHVYPAGASLYFTVGCAQAEDPVKQWRAAKAAASDAILAAGGSITHHHGVGLDHRDWYEREVGELALRALRAVKAQLDPAGIMNPGVLIPPE
jgi:alkyldihydroxyacetonephosphate synthase